MNEISFKSDTLYSQIAVFLFGLENPFNDWSDTHFNQGFSWREGSVSFGTLSENEQCNITVRITDNLEVNSNVIRAITVPFYINFKGIEVGNVMETKAIDIEEGMYELLFTIQVENSVEHYIFNFIRNNNPKANIIIADEKLKTSTTLLMEAEPAV
jgi:Competence protein J (ComJ)